MPSEQAAIRDRIKAYKNLLKGERDPFKQKTLKQWIAQAEDSLREHAYVDSAKPKPR